MQSDNDVSIDSLDEYYQNVNERSKSFDDDPLRDDREAKTKKSSPNKKKKPANSKKRKRSETFASDGTTPGQSGNQKKAPKAKKAKLNKQKQNAKSNKKPNSPDKNSKKFNSSKKNDKTENTEFDFFAGEDSLSISSDDKEQNDTNKENSKFKTEKKSSAYETDEEDEDVKDKNKDKSAYETDDDDKSSDSSDEDSELYNEKMTKQKLIENLNLQNVVCDDSSFEEDPDDDQKNENIEIKTETIPSFFREQFVNKDGDLNYDKLEKKSREVKRHPRMKKILKTHLTTEEEEEALELDEEGFKFEPCMLSKDFYVLHRLRLDTIERREKELALRDKDDNDEEEAMRTRNDTGATSQQEKKSKTKEMRLSEKLNDIAKDINYISYEQGYDKSRCLACRHGNSSSARIAIGPFNDLIENYKRNRNYKNKLELAFDLAEQFEKNIRKPANDMKKEDEEDIPIFTAEQIYMHIRFHTSDPEEWQHSVEEQAQNIRNHIYHNQMFRVPKSKIDSTTSVSGRRAIMNSVQRYNQIDPTSIKVSDKYFKMWKEVVAVEEKVKKLKPENLRGYDKTSRIKVADNTSFVNTNRKWHVEEKQYNESLWDNI